MSCLCGGGWRMSYTIVVTSGGQVDGRNVMEVRPVHMCCAPASSHAPHKGNRAGRPIRQIRSFMRSPHPTHPAGQNLNISTTRKAKQAPPGEFAPCIILPAFFFFLLRPMAFAAGMGLACGMLAIQIYWWVVKKNGLRCSRRGRK